QMMAGDPEFYALWKNQVPITISFPPIVDAQGQLTKDTIDMLVTKGILSDKTALELSVLAPRIKDIDAEVKQAREDAKEANDRNAVVLPDNQPGRVNDELD